MSGHDSHDNLLEFAREGNHNKVREIMKTGVDINFQTALHVSSYMGKVLVVKLLLTHPKIDVFIKDTYEPRSRSALDLAKESTEGTEGREEIIRLLRKRINDYRPPEYGGNMNNTNSSKPDTVQFGSTAKSPDTWYYDQLERLNTEIEHAEGKVRNKAMEIRNYEKIVQENENILETTNRKNKQLIDMVKAREGEVLRIRGEFNQSQKESFTLRKKIETLEESVLSKDEIIRTFQTELAYNEKKYIQKKKDLEYRLSSKETRIIQLTDEIKKINITNHQRHESLKKKFFQILSKKERQEEEEVEEEVANASDKTEGMMFKDMLDERENEIIELEERMKEMKDSYESRIEELEKVQMESNEKDQIVQDLQLIITGKDNETQKLRLRIQELKRQNNSGHPSPALQSSSSDSGDAKKFGILSRNKSVPTKRKIRTKRRASPETDDRKPRNTPSPASPSGQGFFSSIFGWGNPPKASQPQKPSSIPLESRKKKKKNRMIRKIEGMNSERVEEIKRLERELGVRENENRKLCLEISKLKDSMNRLVSKQRKVMRDLGSTRLKIFKIDEKEIKMGSEIGRGGFGKVYSARWKVTRNIAVKEITFTREFDKPAILKEFEDQVALVHPNILRVYGYSDGTSLGSKRILILMEKLDYDLMNYVDKRRPSIPMKIELMRNMVESLHFLHTRDPIILHRDIKSYNFLTDKQGKDLKITDFGMLKTMQSSVSFVKSKMMGSLLWMAPELLQREAMYSVYSDIYALGVTFWELLYEECPHQGMNQHVIFDEVKNRGLRPPITGKKSPDFPSELIELMKRMWHQDRKRRPATHLLLKWFEANGERLKKKYRGRRFPDE